MEAIGSLPKGELRAFAAATGWSLNFRNGAAPAPLAGEQNSLSWSAPVNPGVGTTLRHP